MAETLDDRYRRLLARQLAMNEKTWAVLEARGVNETTELRLDFFYFAPDLVSAEALKAVLDEQTDYDVSIEPNSTPGVAPFSVVGSTQSTTVSAAILDQWVDWMVTAGLHQNCEFDGWGAEA